MTPADSTDLTEASATVATVATGTTTEILRSAPLPPDQHPVAVYLARLASGSRRTVLGRLDTLAALVSEELSAQTLPWHLLRYQHTQALRAKVAEKYAPATANAMLSALRGVLKEAWRLGHLSSEDHARATDLGIVRGERLSRARALDEESVERLFRACERDTVKGARDRALLALLFGGGLRRSEACSVRLDQYTPRRKCLRVVGKGNVEREVPLGRYAAHLDAWIATRGHAAGPILTSVTPPRDRLTREGTKTYEPGAVARTATGGLAHLTDDGLYKILADLAAAAGVGRLAPHDARRTRITSLFRAGVDALQVQRFAGHKQITTTGRYDMRDADELAQAVERADSALGGVPGSASEAWAPDEDEGEDGEDPEDLGPQAPEGPPSGAPTGNPPSPADRTDSTPGGTPQGTPAVSRKGPKGPGR